MESKLFNLSVNATNSWNILNRLSGTFSKKRLEVRSHRCDQSNDKSIYQFNFELFITPKNIETLRKQITRFIDVQSVFYSEINEHEKSLFQLSPRRETLVNEYNYKNR